MGWVIALLVAILAVLVGGILLLSWQLGEIGAELVMQIARLRVEVAAGLGVNVNDPKGYKEGGHLGYIKDDVKDRRRAEGEARGF